MLKEGRPSRCGVADIKARLRAAIAAFADLQGVGSTVQTLSVLRRSRQTFDLISQPVLSSFVLLHQLSALPLRQDSLIQLSREALKKTDPLKPNSDTDSAHAVFTKSSLFNLFLL